MLLVIVTLQGSILDELERSLENHMIFEHMIFFLIGALSVIVAEILLKAITLRNMNRQYTKKVISKKTTGNILAIDSLTPEGFSQYWKIFLRKIFRINKHAWIWIVIALLLMSVWHIPAVFDYASTHPLAHVLQHISFIVVGAAIFVSIRILGESFNLFLLLSLVGMMGLGGLMFAILESPIYQVYSIISHHNTGFYMIISSILLLVVITPLYLIRRTVFHLRVKGHI